MRKLPVIIPSFHSRDLLLTCLRSFKKFEPSNELQYIIVENSSDTSYKDEALAIFGDSRTTWINNATKLDGSEANAEAIDIAVRQLGSSKWVFICHVDVCVTSHSFFPALKEKAQNNELVGTVIDPARINAVHVSGLLCSVRIASEINFAPRYENGKQVMDAGDELTEYCNKNAMRFYCFRNTFNTPSFIGTLPEKYAQLHVDRCLDDNGNVMFMHLGRGIPKTNKTYNKPGRVSLEEWVDFCDREILHD